MERNESEMLRKFGDDSAVITLDRFVGGEGSISPFLFSPHFTLHFLHGAAAAAAGAADCFLCCPT